MIATPRPGASVSEPTLFVAFELSLREWKLALTAGLGVAPILRTVAAGHWGGVQRAVSQARQRFQLPATARVVSCYEAGREGFWLHRALLAQGLVNRVVDSASIQVDRRKKRAKTDRIDATHLVQALVRAGLGERGVWREVQVPTVAAEAARQVSRERTSLVQERTRLVNQMRGWLATWGTRLPRRLTGRWWTQVRDWEGQALPASLQERLARAATRLALLATQVTALEAQQGTTLAAAPTGSAAARLLQLKGLAQRGVSVLLDEGLEWRAFRNRRQIGGLLGFAPTPYASGTLQREQGISRAGNTRLQAVSIQLAWNWVRWQPDSSLTQWYRARFGTGGRARRIGIVAVARKLVIALWRYITLGVVPAGARLKSPVAA